MWNKKKKGCALIYTHKALDQAVVDTKYGINYNGQRFSFNGNRFDTLEQAKEFALSTIKKENESE